MIAFAIFLSLLATPVDENTDAVTVAFESFKVLDASTQEDILAAIEERLSKVTEPDLVKLRELRERAKRELPVKPASPLVYYEHSDYAPIQSPRHYVELGSYDANLVWDTMRPWENMSPFAVTHHSYDFAADCARAAQNKPAPADRLSDLMLGLLPESDLIVAWIEWRLDTKDDLNKIADHFGHAYCDRVGNCFSEVTIYDAYASQNAMEMSDIDVIAYAKNILNDNSFHSPIAADLKRAKLYERMNEDFLRYFRHRTFVEACAWLYLNPDAPLREVHEGLRERIFTLYSKHPTFDAVAQTWRTFKDRDDFTEKCDGWRKDEKVLVKSTEWRTTRNNTRWTVHDTVKAVLIERGVWPGEGTTPAPTPAPSTEPESKPTGGGGGDSGGEQAPASKASESANEQQADPPVRANPQPEVKKMLNVGDVAPDFSVPDETGRVRTLAEFRGKTVLLWFYPKASTPG